MRELSTEWTKHCKDTKEKDKVVQLLRNSTISLGLLRTLLKRRMQALIVSERKTEAYDSPNWAYMQAHTNGMLAAYNNIDQLLSFMDKE
jgi:hypothetical protein